MIHVDQLSADFGIHEIKTLRIDSGRKVAVVGPNGAGKTTLLKFLFGLYLPKSGTITTSGQIPSLLAPKERLKYVSYLPALEHRVPRMTVTESVALAFNAQRPAFGQLTDKQLERLSWTLRKVGLLHKADHQVQTLSSGEYQRVRLARQYAQDAPIMLMDEPFTFLDPAQVISSMQTLLELDQGARTIIMSLHDLNHAASCCDEILLLQDGHLILHDNTKTVLQSKSLREVFKVGFTNVKHPITEQIHLLYPELEIPN